MPFKSKNTTRCYRFSQLVADHLQSKRRGDTLIVETGFPTSIIDLYFRNRRRFRKFSDKKQRRSDLSNRLLESNDSSSKSLNYRESDEIIEDASNADVDVNVSVSLSEIEQSGVEMACLNRVLVSGLKVLLMAVLALGTKRFTIGITVAAFLLFFLESRLSKSCLDPRTLLQSRIHRTKITLSFESNPTPVVCNEASKIEEHKDASSSSASEGSVEIKHKKSCRAKLKSKMLKLLPKKNSKIACGFKEELAFEQHNDSKLLNECLDSDGGLKKEDKFIRRERLLHLSNECDLGDKEMRSNSGFWVLCLVVLVGLIRGRIWGVVLAISWCLMLKMTQWRHGRLRIL